MDYFLQGIWKYNVAMRVCHISFQQWRKQYSIYLDFVIEETCQVIPCRNEFLNILTSRQISFGFRVKLLSPWHAFCIEKYLFRSKVRDWRCRNNNLVYSLVTTHNYGFFSEDNLCYFHEIWIRSKVILRFLLIIYAEGSLFAKSHMSEGNVVQPWCVTSVRVYMVI